MTFTGVRSKTAASIALVAVSVVFGVVDAEFQRYGGSDQIMLAISNMSALYLCLAFVAGLLLGIAGANSYAGAFAGLVATFLALLVFYTVAVDFNHFGMVAGHVAFHRYAAGGVFSGPVFGLLGHRLASAKPGVSLWGLASACLGEPYAWRHHLGFLIGASSVWRDEQWAGLTLILIWVLYLASKLLSRFRTS